MEVLNTWIEWRGRACADMRTRDKQIILAWLEKAVWLEIDEVGNRKALDSQTRQLWFDVDTGGNHELRYGLMDRVLPAAWCEEDGKGEIGGRQESIWEGWGVVGVSSELVELYISPPKSITNEWGRLIYSPQGTLYFRYPIAVTSSATSSDIPPSLGIPYRQLVFS